MDLLVVVTPPPAIYHEQNWYFQGIDTSKIADKGKNGFSHLILNDSESIYIPNKPDIKYFLKVYIKKILSIKRQEISWVKDQPNLINRRWCYKC